MTETQKLFLSAAESVAKSHVEQITQSVVASMCDLDATELFGDVASRHCWDDYCWQLQDGPYDNDDIGFGSTEQNFRAIAETFIQAELEKISPATLLLLRAANKTLSSTDMHSALCSAWEETRTRKSAQRCTRNCRHCCL